MNGGAHAAEACASQKPLSCDTTAPICSRTATAEDATGALDPPDMGGWMIVSSTDELGTDVGDLHVAARAVGVVPSRAESAIRIPSARCSQRM